MKTRKLLTALAFLSIGSVLASEQESSHVMRNTAELGRALQTATPGDIIEMADGQRG